MGLDSRLELGMLTEPAERVARLPKISLGIVPVTLGGQERKYYGNRGVLVLNLQKLHHLTNAIRMG